MMLLLSNYHLPGLSLSVLQTAPRLVSILALRVCPVLTARSFSISLARAKHPSQNRTGSSRLDFSEETCRTRNTRMDIRFIVKAVIT